MKMTVLEGFLAVIVGMLIGGALTVGHESNDSKVAGASKGHREGSVLLKVDPEGSITVQPTFTDENKTVVGSEIKVPLRTKPADLLTSPTTVMGLMVGLTGLLLGRVWLILGSILGGIMTMGMVFGMSWYPERTKAVLYKGGQVLLMLVGVALVSTGVFAGVKSLAELELTSLTDEIPKTDLGSGTGVTTLIWWFGWPR